MENKRDFKGKFLSVLENGKTFYAVLAAGVLVRVGVLIALAPTRFFSDAMAYHIFARRLAEGETFRPSWPPGLPLILAGSYALFGPDYIVGRFVMLGIYVVFAALLFLLAKRLSGTAAANLSVLIFSFYPLCVYYSLTPLTQLVAATLLIGVALATLSLSGKKRWSVAVVLGFLLGFLTLTRPSCTLVLLAVPAYFMFRRGYRLKAGVIFVIAILPVVLWCYSVYRVKDRVVFINTTNAANFFIGNNEYTPLYKTWYFSTHAKSDEAEKLVPEEYKALKKNIREYPFYERRGYYWKSAIRHIINKPHLFAIRTFSRIRVYFAFDIYMYAILSGPYKWSRVSALAVGAVDAVIYLLLLAGATISLFSLRRSFPGKGAIPILLGIPLTYSIPYFLAYSHPTYHFPIVPFLALLTVTLIINISKSSSEYSVYFQSLKRWQVFSIILALAFVLFIQVEWFIAMMGRF
jgi:4-amino-4-deoxy-L-arabinose transferase-like glycosyltransferase